jgi:hypothetical protein
LIYWVWAVVNAADDDSDGRGGAAYWLFYCFFDLIIGSLLLNLVISTLSAAFLLFPFLTRLLPYLCYLLYCLSVSIINRSQRGKISMIGRDPGQALEPLWMSTRGYRVFFDEDGQGVSEDGRWEDAYPCVYGWRN